VTDTRMGAEEAMVAREASARQAEGGEQATRRMNALTSRIGAVALALGFILLSPFTGKPHGQPGRIHGVRPQ
jgi:hypothetical protein